MINIINNLINFFSTGCACIRISFFSPPFQFSRIRIYFLFQIFSSTYKRKQEVGDVNYKRNSSFSFATDIPCMSFKKIFFKINANVCHNEYKNEKRFFLLFSHIFNCCRLLSTYMSLCVYMWNKFYASGGIFYWFWIHLFHESSSRFSEKKNFLHNSGVLLVRSYFIEPPIRRVENPACE